MKVPISWLKDFVEITLSIEELAERLTLAGLEVGSINYIGLPGADLEWDREKLILGHLLKVEQHPNADRLVLATVDIGAEEPETVVTGAPNLFEFVGRGDIRRLGLKSPFVMEGATVYDGYSKEPGAKMTLKGRKIRGIMNRHMLCSEKELGLSDDHGGIILTADETAPPGTPLVDLWGDAVLDIDLTPNLSRAASILGVAREVAALTHQKVHYPDITLPPPAERGVLEKDLVLETTEPELNPRFVAVLITGITIKPSPYWMQLRLRLAGMRPINNIVDVSNYVMLETGQPNHAFDWDILRRRADEYAGSDQPVKIITRLAKPEETVLTLDGKTHKMPDYSILVTDPKSNLSIGGIMGGEESEVSEISQNILLEAAAWNFINIRRTSQALNIYSEAAYRFSRGVHPALAMMGALRGTKLMLELAGGTLASEVKDYYPHPPKPITIDLPQAEVTRLLGLELAMEEIAQILESLEFTVEDSSEEPLTKRVTVPAHRLDISSETVTGQADLIEEIARIYGYDRIPVSEIADELPPQRGNPAFEGEEQARNLLVEIGLQETISYRLTTPEAEARILGQENVNPAHYVRLANPSTPERSVMRHTVLNSVLENVAHNSKHRERIRIFEIGDIYLPDNEESEGEAAILPQELRRLALAMTGPRGMSHWLPTDLALVDFFDLKGVVEALLKGLHIQAATFKPTKHKSYFPGRVADLEINGHSVGILGQLHPLVVAAYDIQVEEEQPVLVADFDLELLLAQRPELYAVQAVPRFPAVQQDIAIVVDEAIPASQVKALIAQTGQPLLVDVSLFDLYRGEQIGANQKSLAYSLTFQSPDRTLTDKVVARQQKKIIKRLERELNAKLRS